MQLIGFKIWSQRVEVALGQGALFWRTTMGTTITVPIKFLATCPPFQGTYGWI